MDPHAPRRVRKKSKLRGVMLRGLTLVLPPILTIVILVWIVSTIEAYFLKPVTLAAREVVVTAIEDVRDSAPDAAQTDGKQYERLASGEYVPSDVVNWVRNNVPASRLPETGQGVYREYVEARFLQPQVVVPVFLCLFVLFLYVLGKFLASEIGRLFDWGILHLPIVRKVYSAVKQVTDLVFGENTAESQHIHYRRVVAIEYPRPGLWSIGLVVGEAVMDVTAAANEPCVTVMLPTSPAIFTVKPVMVPQSKTHDVKLTIDQVLQFIISCGVVLPAEQLAVPSKATPPGIQGQNVIEASSGTKKIDRADGTRDA
jgi:uncharacterized membrane protein